MNFLGIIFLLMSAFIWGVAFIPTRYNGGAGISPYLELLIRNSVPFIIIGVVWLKHIIKTPIDTIKKSILAGSILFITITCNIYGIRMVEFGSTGSLLDSLSVILVPLYFVIFKKEKLSPILLLAAVLSFTGTSVLTIGLPDTPFNWGTVLCLLTSFGYAFYIIFCSKILSDDLHPITLHFFQSLTFILWSIPFVMVIDLPTISQIDWSDTRLLQSLAFIALCAGTIAYPLYFYGQKVTSPVMTSVLLSSSEIFAMLADFSINRIHLTTIQMIGYACITVAIFVAPLQNKIKDSTE